MKNEILRKSEINLLEEQESFLSYLDVSELTLKAYKDGIKTFLAYLSKNNIKNPTRDSFRAFREELKINASVNTTNSYLTSVRRFFSYLETNGLYENITKDVKNVKTTKVPVKQVLTLEQCKEIANNLVDPREKCIFSLAITTGLRAEEIATSRIENIKVYNNEIVLFHKCKKRQDSQEYVKLSSEVYTAIKNYIGERKDGYIFVSTSNHNNGGGVTNTTIRRIVKSIFKRFGFESDGFSCHSLRRTAGTLMYEAGQSIYDIQQVLHHNSIQTTTRYIQQSTRNTNNSEKIISSLILG